MAIERNPAAAEAAVAAGFEVMSHGYRWIDYADIPEDIEREHMHRAIEIITRICGSRPLGWCTGRPSMNTRKLVVEEGGFLYDSDSLSDDLPYWERVAGHDHLVIPHQFDTNDTKFVHVNGFAHGGHYESYLRDSFDTLYREGEFTPRMMTLSMHPRIIGRPGRIAALERFLDYVLSKDKVWITTRADIAKHWMAEHPAP
jgi:peptidoglycan/xylan/chitin deacetylase (PgdA/CDA1 family)